MAPGRLSAEYRPVDGRHDTAVDADGSPRPGWDRLLAALDRLGPDELRRRQAAADRLVTAQGAGVLLHDGAAEAVRPWRLDVVPLVVGTDAWATVAAGLIERAELLRAVVADLHGARRLLRAGVVPVEAVAAHGAALRSAWVGAAAQEGAAPAGPPSLVTAAVDLTVDAAGRWRVQRDVTDVTTGDGHALLARAIAGRVLPQTRARLRVAGHARWTSALRATLAAATPAGRTSPRTVVLTGAPDDPGYVEHAHLASQLGYHVAEAADVVVRQGRAWLRSLEGLEPVDVLFRRLPERVLDPVEDDRSGDEGVAGVVEAVRCGGAALVNPYGTAIGEHLALLPFLDEASRLLRGRPLALPGPEVLWCGDPDHRASVVAAPDRYVLEDAGPGPGAACGPVALGRLDDAAAAAWLARVGRQPERYVARPAGTALGTSPCLVDGRLRPATVVVRAQVVLGPDGPVVLPGGHGRVVDPVTSAAPHGGVGKDVWVVDADRRERVVVTGVPVPAIPQVDLRRSVATRAAEAMYWTGRHAERAETAARTALACMARGLGTGLDPVDTVGLVKAVRAVSGGLATAVEVGDTGGDGQRLPGAAGGPDLDAEVRAALSGRLASVAGSLRATVAAARSARALLSGGTWRLLPMLDDQAAVLDRVAKAPDLAAFDATEALDGVLLPLAALAGLTAESVVRGPAWRFLDLGRRLQRALLVLGVAEATFDPPPGPASGGVRLEVALAACESLVAYRRRYRSDVTVEAVADLLLGDPSNPRSVRFQLEQLAIDLHHLPDRPVRRRQLAAVRAAGHALDRHLPLVAGRGGATGLVLDVREPMLEVGASMAGGWFTERLRRVR